MTADIQNKIKELIGKDDMQALELIYDQIGGKLFGYTAAMLSSKHEAEDLMQELFIKLTEKIELLKKAGNLPGYIFGMMRNLIAGQLRIKQRDKNRMLSFEDYLVPREEDAKFSKDEADELNKALSELPEEQKEVLVLKIFQDMTFDEISRCLGESINTVSSR